MTDFSDTPSPAWIYAIPERARRSWGVAAIIMTLVLSVIALVIAGFGFGLSYSLVYEISTWLSELGMSWTDIGLTGEMGLMLVLNAMILVLVFAWVKWGERRKLDSIGLAGPGWWLRWVRGLIIGLGTVILLDMLRGALWGTEHPGEGGSYLLWVMFNLDLNRLVEPSLLIGYALIAVIFFFQSFSEEVMFRGWLMSALAARWGLAAALIVNSVVFGLFHSHHFMAGLGIGFVAVLGITFVGGFLSLLALSERSIAGAAGVHGGFNAGLVLTYSASTFLENPDTGAGAAAAEVLQDVTGSEDSIEIGLSLASWAQAILFAILVLYVIYRLKTRRQPLLS